MEEQQLKINLTPDVAGGTYANLAIIAHSQSEFILDFISLLPGMQQANVQSRIVLTPENAKKLMMALQDNMAKFEKQFGKVQVSNTPPMGSTIPMSFGSGEA